MRDSIIFKTKEDAERVLDAAKQIISGFSWLTVSDLKDLVGFTTIYEDTKRGWDKLDEFKLKEVADGYSLSFPEPQFL